MATQTKARKTAPKKSVPAQRPPELDDFPDEVVDLDAMEEPDSGPFEVFRLRGKVYTIPQRPNAALALKSMWLAKQYGEDEAASRIVQEVLGDELMAVLMSYDKFNLKMLDLVTKRIMGAIFTVQESEDSRGN
jgi:hypothetical protein